MAATLCHRSGDSLSYTASAFSNSLFSAGVHFELLLSWSRPQLGGRISLSHFITSQFTMHQLILKPINSPKPRRSRSFVYWLRLLYMFFFFVIYCKLQIWGFWILVKTEEKAERDRGKWKCRVVDWRLRFQGNNNINVKSWSILKGIRIPFPFLCIAIA